MNPSHYPVTLQNLSNLYFDDKEAARHMYEYYKVQLQVLCWGRGEFLSAPKILFLYLIKKDK